MRTSISSSPSATRVINYVNSQGIPGIEELVADIKLGVPELEVKIDREAARRFGLSTFQIASALRTSVYGKEISKYKLGEDEYPIFLRLDEKDRNKVEIATGPTDHFPRPDERPNQPSTDPYRR